MAVAARRPNRRRPTRPSVGAGADGRGRRRHAEVLDEINSLNAYQRPNLPLKLDDRYAHTPDDVTPLRHVEAVQDGTSCCRWSTRGRAARSPNRRTSTTVKIGFLGPIEPTVSVATGGKSHEETLGKQMLQGCQLAIEEANAQGGYLKRKIPFELVVSNDNGLWGSSGEEIIKLAYKDNVWAILGSIDGANSHIAIRVGLKIEIPMMNSGDTDPTFIETNIPWVFRCIGDDRQQCYLLADYLYRKLNLPARRHHPRQQPLRPVRRPRDPRRQPAARTTRSRSRWPIASATRISRCS